MPFVLDQDSVDAVVAVGRDADDLARRQQAGVGLRGVEGVGAQLSSSRIVKACELVAQPLSTLQVQIAFVVLTSSAFTATRSFTCGRVESSATGSVNKHPAAHNAGLASPTC